MFVMALKDPKDFTQLKLRLYRLINKPTYLQMKTAYLLIDKNNVFKENLVKRIAFHGCRKS